MNHKTIPTAIPLVSFLVVMGMLLGMLLPPTQVAEAKPPATSGLSTPITGTGPAGVSFTGTFEIERFATQDGELVAVGNLTGTLTDALGNVIGAVSETISLPVSASGTCQILYLELGPLDLDLLGLEVHLDQVVLDITAQSGPGNLLGNLLCGIAGLLDSDASNNVVARLLNQLLGLLG